MRIQTYNQVFSTEYSGITLSALKYLKINNPLHQNILNHWYWRSTDAPSFRNTVFLLSPRSSGSENGGNGLSRYHYIIRPTYFITSEASFNSSSRWWGSPWQPSSHHVNPPANNTRGFSVRCHYTKSSVAGYPEVIWQPRDAPKKTMNNNTKWEWQSSGGV